MQAQQFRGIALANTQAQAVLTIENDYRLTGRHGRKVRMQLTHHVAAKVHGQGPAVAHGFYCGARNIGNQVAVVVHVGDVPGDAVVLQAQLPVVELVHGGHHRAEAGERLALGQGYGGGQQHIAGGGGRAGGRQRHQLLGHAVGQQGENAVVAGQKIMTLEQSRQPARLGARAVVVDADDVDCARRKILEYGSENVNGMRNVEGFDAVADVDHRNCRGQVQQPRFQRRNVVVAVAKICQQRNQSHACVP